MKEVHYQAVLIIYVLVGKISSVSIKLKLPKGFVPLSIKLGEEGSV